MTAERPAALQEDVVVAATELRAAFASLVTALPGSPRSAIEVERALGVNKKLAWQIYRAATTTDALNVGVRSPGPTALSRVAQAATKLGVDPAITERLREASDSFQAMVSRHADDRSMFGLMVSATTGDGLSAREGDLKRADFRTRREIMGKYAEVDVFTLIVTPGQKPGFVNLCSVRGLARLHRLRPDVELEISRHRFDRSDGTVNRREAIDPAQTIGDPPIALLTEFSSEPLPELRQSESSSGFIRTVAETPVLGLQSAVTCMLADVTRNSPVLDEGDPQGLRGVGHIHEISTPAGVLLHDMLIDERLEARGLPELRVIARRSDAEHWPGDDRSTLLPIQERVTDVGRGPSAWATPELPEFTDMMRHVCSTLGWDCERLRLFRARIEYPVVNSVVWMRLDLSERA